MPDATMPQPYKSKGFLGWLGRQFGHVKKAIDTDVTAAVPTEVVYRNTQVHQQPHPEQPHVTLRRTTVDEVIVSSSNKPQATINTQPTKPNE